MNEFNLKSSTIEKSIDLVKEFLGKLIGPTVEEIGGLFSDNVRMIRLRNQVRNIEKIKKIVEEEGITMKQVNLKAVVPYIEGVSLEEDETLQDMWANLMVNYMDSEKNLTLFVYPQILKQLSTNEIKLLIHIESVLMPFDASPFVQKSMDFNAEEISNLERLGLIEEQSAYSTYDYDKDMDGHTRIKIEQLTTGRYYLTNFGRNFLYACKR